MSFLSDLFKGNFSNLGSDLAPSNILSDTVQDIGGSNTIPELLGVGGLALGGLGLSALSDLGGLSTDLGDISAAAATAPSLGAATAAGGDAADLAALPATATLDTGTVPSDLTAAYSSAFPGSPLTATATDLTSPAATASLYPVTGALPDAAVAGAIPPAATPGLWDTVSSALTPVGNAIKTVAPIAGLAGLGYNLYSGYEQKQQLNQLAGQEAASAATEANVANTEISAANPLLTSGNTLQQYLTTGTLPPQFQSQVTQATDAAKASIIQGYASRGMSTDPQNNSALAQDLANVDQQALTLQASLEETLATAGGQMISQANQLLQSGASATEISAQIPIAMQQLDSTLNAQTAQAISTFASAVGGGGRNPNAINITLPQGLQGAGVNLG
jgi:hypothetical protein